MATAMVSLRVLETLSYSRVGGCFYLKLAKYISRYAIFDNHEGKSFRSRDSNALTDFSDLPIPPKLLERLEEQNILSPNEVQKKVLPHVMRGRSAVVNSETGSGKTLCYLLPILSRLYQSHTKGERIPSPLAAVIVPTPELAYQVNSVYRSLAPPKWHSSVAHAESRLQLTENTHLVIATGSSLRHYYPPRVFKALKILVLDEVDVLLSGSERSFCWQLLSFFKKSVNSQIKRQQGLVGVGERVSSELSSCEAASLSSSSIPHSEQHQFIFVGATIPARGRMTVAARIRQWVPGGTLFISTNHAHKAVNAAQFKFIKSEGKQEKNAALLNILKDSENIGSTSTSSSVDRKQQVHSTTLSAAPRGGKDLNTKVLIFCENETNVDSLHTALTTSAVEQLSGRVGKLHAGLTVQERLNVVKDLRDDTINVLICTNILSRGLDLPDVGLVIQYDCPNNVADFLHRSGRTARIGQSGRVVCFYDHSRSSLVEVIQEAIHSKELTFDHLFSRNKVLGRKLKKIKKHKLCQETTSNHDK